MMSKKINFYAHWKNVSLLIHAFLKTLARIALKSFSGLATT